MGHSQKVLIFFATVLAAAGLSARGFAAGGVSGGGGNLLITGPANPSLPVDQVVGRIRALKPPVQAFLADRQARYRAGSLAAAETEALAPLFERYADIASAVEPIEVRIVANAPCFDEQGRAFDGSTAGLGSGQVCISALEASRKLVVDEIAPQVSALLAHELGEALGLDDASAVRIQKLVAHDFGR